MNKDKYVFAQLIEILDNNKFPQYVSHTFSMTPCAETFIGQCNNPS